ncbi:VirB4 family type IV secretion/conjugal transfer ATPase [Legionella erythra]|uniref:Vir protein n=1 Tax=Legionella erythra TaxID=448 RepID=A0A0W0TT97_LEGER|nr:VirB4 family type IV secretion/conjugal transfer ATPase [Legionella erythra]KTC98688.1 vir protein [Legionella erythra]
MSLSNTLKQLRHETPISRVFPVTHFNSPTVFESHHGLLGATLQIAGIPFVTENPDFLNQMNERLHQALLTIDERFMVYVTVHRKKESLHLGGNFQSRFAWRVNDKYHARFTGKKLYRNAIYLTLVLKGDDSSQTARSLHWFEKLNASRHLHNNMAHRDAQMALLNQQIDNLKTALSAFGVHRLGEQDERLGYSELMAFLGLWVNGGEAPVLSYPTFCPPISPSLPDTWVSETLYPEGHIGQYLSRKQLFFGHAIQFQGNADNDKRFGAMLSVKKYGKHTHSLLLDPLLQLDAEFIATHSFAPIPRDAALKAINKKRGKLINANDLGISQIQALETLEDDLASDNARLGYHHNTLMLLANDTATLDNLIRETETLYAQADMTLVRERLGLEPAFWAQIPTNHAFIARASLITSSNFVGFCSLHNFKTGFRDGNHLGSAVTLLETPSKTPVYFNYHSQSSATNPAKGHTAIFGATNAGKNTLVAFMDAQMERYGHRSFFLDRDQASKIYVLSSEKSAYTIISPAHAKTLRMNPLQLPDTKANRSFIKEWFAQLIRQPNEDDLPSTLTETINECIDYAFEHLQSRYRTLSNVSKLLPMDFARWPELRRWLKGQGTMGDGEFAWLFDHEEDALNFDFDKVGFDITYLMDEVSPLISTPVYLYLLHRMRQCLDGRLTSFIIDEAWQVLNSPFWLKHLKSWLATIRKKNGHFIFMTQTPESVVQSSIASVILTNLATTVYFPNQAAHADTYLNHLQLTPTEYDTIKGLTPESRLFLYKQGHESLLCKLDLSDLAEEIRVFSGNQQSVALFDAIVTEVGSQPEQWLPVFLERSWS